MQVPVLAGCNSLQGEVCELAAAGNPTACEPTLRFATDDRPAEARLAIWYPDPNAVLRVTVDGDEARGALALRTTHVLDDGQRLDVEVLDDASTLTLHAGERIVHSWTLARPAQEPPELTRARAALGVAVGDPARLAASAALEATLPSLDSSVRLKALDVLADLGFQDAFQADPASRDEVWIRTLARTEAVFQAAREQDDIARAACHVCRGVEASLNAGADSALTAWESRLESLVSGGVGDDSLASTCLSFYRGSLALRIGDLQRATREFQAARGAAERWGHGAIEDAAEYQLVTTYARLMRDDEALEVLRHAEERVVDHSCLNWLYIVNAEGWANFLLADLRRPARDAIPSLELARTVLAFPADEQSTPSRDRCRNDMLLDHVNLNLALASEAEGWVGFSEALLDQLSPDDGNDPEFEFWREELEQRLVLARSDRGELAEFLLHEHDGTGDPDQNWSSAWARGRAFEALGLTDDALAEYALADGALAQMMSRLDFDGGRDRLLASRQQSSTRRVLLLLGEGRVDEALCVARLARRRSNAVLDRVARIASLSASEREKWASMITAHERLGAQLDEHENRRWETPVAERRGHDEQTAAMAKQLELARADAFEFLFGASEIGSEQERCATLRPPSDRELMLIYFPTDRPDRWVAFASTRARTDYAIVEETPSVRGDLQRLSEALLQPFADHIRSAESIRILPTAELWNVPFFALPWDEDVLVARAPVSMALDLARPSVPEPANAGTALIVADPSSDLAAAADEAADVSRALVDRGWNVQQLTGTDARLVDVRAAMVEADLFHYAGHGRHAGVEGWGSALRLAGGMLLTVEDVLALERVPSLVILPACDTAPSGEGTLAGGMNIGRAFLLSGAEVVIAATGEIEDRAAGSFSTSFHAAFLQSTSPAEAMRVALLANRHAGSPAPSPTADPLRRMTLLTH